MWESIALLLHILQLSVCFGPAASSSIPGQQMHKQNRYAGYVAFTAFNSSF